MRKIGLVLLVLAACGRKHPPLTITITADGYVKLNGEVVTLDQLGTFLEAAKRIVPEEGHPHGGRVSALPVRLDLEEETPWRHVLMVMSILADQKVWRLTLPGQRDLRLPSDSWHASSPEGKALLIRLLVLDSGEYVVGDRVASDVERAGSWIDAESSEGVLCRVAVIRAASRVSWRPVRSALDLLRSRDVKQIDFYGVFSLEEVRDASPLPPPL